MLNKRESAWSRWQMPLMQDEPRTTIVNTEEVSYLMDEALSHARDDARRAGWEQGLSEGRMAARGELRLQAERLQKVIQQLALPLAECNDRVKDELVMLAMVIAKEVIQRELTVQPADVHALVTKAIQALSVGTRHIRIHLHPEDAHLLSAQLEEKEGLSWKIIEDPAISRGGCMVDSGASHVDLRLETRLAELLSRLQTHIPSQADVA